jgi:hypothetical protein
MSHGYAFSVGAYVRDRIGRKGRVAGREAGLYEVAWFGAGKRDWQLPQDLLADETVIPYGWDVAVRMGPPDYREHTYHWRGLSENTASRRAMGKCQGVHVLSVLPITREQWVRAYGDPDIQGNTRRMMS